MAKDKSLKLDTNPPKRKKLSSIDTEGHVEEVMDTKVQKKRKKLEVEVSSTAPCTCFFFFFFFFFFFSLLFGDKK